MSSLIKPMQDYVLLEELEEVKSTSLIILPEKDKANNDKLKLGKIIRTGPGLMVNDKRIEMETLPGDTVYYQYYKARPITINGKKYFLVKESDIYGVLSE